MRALRAHPFAVDEEVLWKLETVRRVRQYPLSDLIPTVSLKYCAIAYLFSLVAISHIRALHGSANIQL